MVRFFAILFITFSLWAPSSLAEEPELRPYAFEDSHMGTLFKFTVYAKSEQGADAAVRVANEKIATLNAKLSDYLPESELMQLCERPAKKPVEVSEDLFQVLKVGVRIAEKSAGAFDMTAGHLTKNWRRAKRKGRLPEPEILRDALAVTGHRWLTLDEDSRTVTLLKPGMLLDLGGIAKGFAADSALRSLMESGFSRAIVAAGGDVAVGDPPPGKFGWPIAISSLDAPEAGEPTTHVLLANCGISTSGDTRQFIVIDDIRYSHIVDPRTGIGLTERIGVTVIAPNATLSDSLATAASVLGLDKGQKLIAEADATEARFVSEELEITTTSGFPEKAGDDE